MSWMSGNTTSNQTLGRHVNTKMFNTKGQGLRGAITILLFWIIGSAAMLVPVCSVYLRGNMPGICQERNSTQSGIACLYHV